MKISLKRALKLRKELEAMLSKVEFPTTGKLSLLIEANVRDPMKAINGYTGSLLDHLKEYETLSATLAAIRVGISKANVQQIEGILASMAHIDRRLSMLRKIAGTGQTPADEEVVAHVSRAVAQPTELRSGYGTQSSTSLSFSVVSAQMIGEANEAIIALKRERADLEDKRAGVNASTQIEIDEDQAEVLRKFGLV
jgi:hypothetical protein